jgi:hypothetical protein
MADNLSLTLLKEPDPESDRRSRKETFLVGPIEGDLVSALTYFTYDYAFIGTSSQTNFDTEDTTFLTAFDLNYSSNLWDLDLTAGAFHKFIYKHPTNDRAVFYESATDPETSFSAIAFKNIVFIASDSRLKIADFLNDVFPSGKICIIFQVAIESYESNYSWESLLKENWGEVYSTPMNIVTQQNDVNLFQMIAPASMVTAMQVEPKQWNLLEFTVWYSSASEGVVNLPQLGETMPVNKNPTTDDTITVVTDPTQFLNIISDVNNDLDLIVFRKRK